MNQIVETKARLPYQPIEGLSEGEWKVLCEATFPNAKTAEAIVMAINYCKARKLDIFKRPVNIVPMWSTQLSKYVETVWPGINEVQVTAARTGAYAGMDKPVWGNNIERKFIGSVKGEIGAKEKTVTFPEFCEVTVWRLIDGQRYSFTEQVFWMEAYAKIGKTELPNDMWEKRPFGQLHKCAKAASLRAAFPEEANYTSDEMEGKVIEEVGSIVIDNVIEKKTSAKEIYGTNQSMIDKWNDIVAMMKHAETKPQLDDVWKEQKSHRLAMKKIDEELYIKLEDAYEAQLQLIQDKQANIAAFGEEAARIMSEAVLEPALPESKRRLCLGG